MDLSAAFDTVDNSLLLSRLRDRFGVNDTSVAWFESYLTALTQFVRVNDCRSAQRSLERGVPQGSVLGPLLYLLYTSPIADIIKFHKLQYHLYAGDTQLYISFRTDSSYDLSLAKRRVECCVNDIDFWMVNNGLKLNQDKTELVLISSKYRCRPSLEFIQVVDEKIQPKPSARNLGVIIDQSLDLIENLHLSTEQKIVIGGDYNVSLNPDLDCSGGNPTKKDSVNCIQDMCLNFDLVDIWRVRNPQCKCFTWRQKSPVIQRRLDYWLLSDSYQEEVNNVDTIPSINSDHSAIVLYLNSVEEQRHGPSYWKFNTSLLDDPKYK